MAMGTDAKNNNNGNNNRLSYQHSYIRKEEAVGLASKASPQSDCHDWTRELPWVLIWEKWG